MQSARTAVRFSQLVSAVIVLSVAPLEARADLIAFWTFEISPPSDLTDSAAIGPIAADSGMGSASGAHADGLTDWSTPAGNGSDNSLSSTRWTAGDYYEFSVSTVGFFDIMVSWDQTRSSTGPATFDLAYSINGGSFVTALNDYDVAEITWLSGGSRNASSFESSDMSSVTAVDGVANLVFRIIADSSAGGTGGTNRVDNFLVEGTAVPEPAAVLFGGVVCGVFALAAAWRRYYHTPAAL